MKTQIIISGMHRSGTSICGGLLNILGIGSGKDSEMVPSNFDNPKSFFERNDVLHLNEKILLDHNSTWDFPNELCFKEIKAEKYSQETKKIYNYLNKEYDTWFIKDPRFCLTYKCWSNVLENKLDIIVVRDPVEVSFSLHKRNQLNIYHNLALYKLYYHKLFQNNFNQKKTIFIYFNELIIEPLKVTKKIYEFLVKNNVLNLKFPEEEKIKQCVEFKISKNFNFNQEKIFNRNVVKIFQKSLDQIEKFNVGFDMRDFYFMDNKNLKLYKHINSIEKEKNLILNSRSFKVTKPLRLIGHHFQKKKKIKTTIDDPQRTKLGQIKSLKNYDTSVLNDYITCCIPTFNAGLDFKYVLQSIRNQKCNLKDIIILDSGSVDETLEIAKRYNCKIFKIKNKDFTHSYSRNLLLNYSKTNIIYFTVQDAIISNDNMLFKMHCSLSLFNLSAISDYQTPRSNADQYSYLTNIIHNNHFYNFPENKLKIFEKDDLENYTLNEIREMSSLDNVSTMYNKAHLLNLSFKGKFSEDIKMGIDLLNSGFKVAKSKFGPVIHSHSRIPEYTLKRVFIEQKSSKTIFGLNKKKNVIKQNYFVFNYKIAIFILCSILRIKKLDLKILNNLETRKKISFSVIFKFLFFYFSRMRYLMNYSNTKADQKTKAIVIAEILAMQLYKDLDSFFFKDIKELFKKLTKGV